MMSPNAERLLHDQPVPPPPEGLAESIKNEIPDNIEIHPALLATDRVVAWHRRLTVRLAVAAVFVVAMTAAVSFRMRQGPTTIPDRPAEPVERVVVSPLEHENRVRRPVPTPKIEAVRSSDADAAVEAPPIQAERRIAEVQASIEPPPVSEGEPPEPADVDARADNELYKEIVTESLNNFSDQVLPNLGVENGGAGVADGFIGTDEAKVVQPGAPVTSGDEPSNAATGDPRRDGQHRSGADRKSVSSSTEVTDEMIEQSMERSFEGEVSVSASVPVSSWRGRWTSTADRRTTPEFRKTPPSTGGTHEPNDQPYGDVLFREYGVNPFIDTEDDRFSTFGLEVDTGSYNVVKRYLSDGHLPPREAVRTEEIVNAFDYGDAPPTDGDFALTAEGAPSPFADGQRYQIVRFGVSALSSGDRERPPAVLTFVVDVSGSMDRENRLVLVKRALFALLDNLREDDRVGLVIYGSRGEVLLEPTTDHDRISRAIDRLRAEGSTNAEEGLVLAYELADRFRDDELINRVILCSDGVANVGRTGPESILERIRGWADNGIELTTVGFGMGNYNDVLMERLADTGDGRYAYVDTFDEARRLFVEELTGTLLTIGSEAKAQVEFNPDVVSRYRLVGYENRDIADEDFRNDAVDAGEIGAGLTATAVYEIKLRRGVSPSSKAEAAILRVRYRPFKTDETVEIERPLRVRDLDRKWEKASPSLKLATLVAEYAEILKGSYWARTGDMDNVLHRARALAPEFEDDARFAEWLDLVEIAADLIDETGDGGARFTD